MPPPGFYSGLVTGDTRKSFSVDQNNLLHVLKNGGPTDCCTQQFSSGLDINRIKIRHLKGENKRESSRRPDSNGWTAIFLKEKAQGDSIEKEGIEYLKSSKTWSNS